MIVVKLRFIVSISRSTDELSLLRRFRQLSAGWRERHSGPGIQGFRQWVAILYNQGSAALAGLPLLLGDIIEYDTPGGAIRMLAIQRATGSPSGIGRTSLLPKARKSPVASVAFSVLPQLATPVGLPLYLAQNCGENSSARATDFTPENIRGGSNPVIQRLYARFPGLNIQRADVVTLYQQWLDPELALVASMI